uniref:DUF223 domain-containing protein n=1 Tax=Brassica oleracea TaxID=3712 RepID=A0A3P6BFP3_BRAOL|nr:unnamed protein product [Brassica oleracea]
MVNLQILLTVLRAGRCSDRLLRFWEARNLRKGGELMCLDMLFVDENILAEIALVPYHCLNFFIQRSISANRQLRFRERLNEGSLYTLSGFDVTRSSPNFRLSDAPFSIRFNDETSLEKKTESVRPIIPMDSNVGFL